MTAMDREVGGSTMIRVSMEVKKMIEDEKIIPREPLNDCIKRGILENRSLKKRHPSIETQDMLRNDMENFVTKPEMWKGGDYRGIWLYNHPGEIIEPDECIHHINGNHNDDHPDNLMKVKRCDHNMLHENDGCKHSKGNDIVGKTI